MKHPINISTPVLIILLLILFSCEEKTDFELHPAPTNTLVIDARLTNENKQQEIRLSKTYLSPSGEAEPVSGAEIWVTFNGSQVNFIEESVTPGLYKTAEAVATAINTLYHLHVAYENKVYEAETYMIPVANPNPITFSPATQTGLYRINWNNGQYSQSEEAMYEADIHWEHLLPQAIEDSLTRARLLFYTLSTIDVSYLIFPQNKEEVLFPAGAIAVLKKYSVTPAYGDFLRALLAETEWQGSLFEEARGNLPTNISNGGLGYFSASSVIVDTVVVQ